MAKQTDQRVVSAVQAKLKIHNAIIQLGLSFSDCVHLIVFNPLVDTACWSYNKLNGEESIQIGPLVAALAVNDIEMVIRHEFLHRSTYHGFSERFQDPVLCNIVLDICINRLLFEAYEEKMQHLSECIYPDESKKSIIALADCSADPKLLDEKLSDLWHYVWSRTEDGSLREINPTSLYYRLVTITSENPGLMPRIPFSLNGSIPDLSQIDPSGVLVDAIRKVLEDLDKRLPGGSGLGRTLSSYSVIPQMVGFSSIERFLKEIQYTIEARSMNAMMEREIRYSRQAFPLFPSRKGILFKLLDIEKELGYYNQVVDWQSKKLKLGFYIDLSGSMVEYYPVLVSFVRVFKNYPLKLCGFSTSVVELSLPDFIGGDIPAGGGTDFNSPIRDFIDDPALAGGILFTDGAGDTDDVTEQALLSSRKVLFIVYLCSPNCPPVKGRLDKIAARTAIFEIE